MLSFTLIVATSHDFSFQLEISAPNAQKLYERFCQSEKSMDRGRLTCTERRIVNQINPSFLAADVRQTNWDN